LDHSIICNFYDTCTAFSRFACLACSRFTHLMCRRSDLF